jgi:hypothetical protein
MLARDVPVTDQLANHRAILALHQCMVLTSASPALGEFGVQFPQHFRHPMMDILRAVVGVKTADGKGKLG